MKVWIASAIALAGYVAARTAVIGGAALTAAPDDPSWQERVWTTMATWPTVARLLTIPGALRFHYRETRFGDAGVTGEAVLGIVLVLVLVGTATFWLSRGDRRPLTAFAFMVLAFLPGSNLIIPIKQLLGERNLYGASIGAAMLIAWAFAKGAEAWRVRGVAVLASALVLFGLVRSGTASLAWESNPALWASAIAADSLDYKPQWSLGIWYLVRGDLQHGGPLVERARELNPSQVQLATDYAQVLQARGMMDSSLAVLGRTMRAAPTSRQVRDVYLTSLIRAGRADSALADLRAAGAGDPLGPSRFRLIAEAHDARGARDSAVVYYGLAIDSAADVYDLRLIEAVVLERSGRMAEGQRVRSGMEQHRSPTAAEAAAIRIRIREELGAPPAH